jgi:hypothetical protein
MTLSFSPSAIPPAVRPDAITRASRAGGVHRSWKPVIGQVDWICKHSPTSQ